MNDSMLNIAPLASCLKKEFRHPSSRLIHALHLQRRFYHEHPIQRDFFAEAEAVAAWSAVTCSYSGIEQTMKCLLQMRDAYIDNPHSSGGHRHHFIGKLFKELASEEQDVLRVSYAIYRSLHDYILPETVDCFLEAIDDGYPTWRYFLLEGSKADGWPKTHPGAMLEIWFVLTDILQARTFTNHGLNTVKHRIDCYFQQTIEDVLSQHIINGIDEREINDINNWFHSHENVPVNACANLFYCHAKERLDLIEVLSSTLPVLRTFVDIVGRQQTDLDVSHFLHRAKTSKIVWNPCQDRFETVSQ